MPAASVTAEPTAAVFSVNVIVRPESGTPSALNIADSVVVPPYVPPAGTTEGWSSTPSAKNSELAKMPYSRASRPMDSAPISGVGPNRS